ncbi:hypothetical protein HPB48_007917 [Haemaphysalis longicornis]|uniref:Uncharacterized protein n=1 Tax=Haemaphysalis longicornis TaxID=44386 RepID=A0A9J6GAH6_HAELO|nr:hypothetical protein HPB48_007917 [Haemaphysalis longicornis]
MHDAADFSRLLLVSNYYATRSACQGQDTLAEHATKISVSLLRYTEHVPADKAFYEAGLACKASCPLRACTLPGGPAIEEGSLDTLDHSDFQDTDIPFEIPLPEKMFLDEAQHEEVKEWVLAVSMNQGVEQALPTDEQGFYEASLEGPKGTMRAEPCLITAVSKRGVSRRSEVPHGMGRRCTKPQLFFSIAWIIRPIIGIASPGR